MIGALALLTAVAAPGCGATRPRNFRAMLHPAPIVRARAAGLNGSQPDSIAIPTLIERLEDQDPVVRMTASEALKERTGKDFGFVPWAEEKDRSGPVDKWRTWWDSKRDATYAMPTAPLGKKRRKP